MGSKTDDMTLSAGAIPADDFATMRAENLARWPTGAEVDLEEAAEFHKFLPEHKQLGWVMRQAASEGRCLTQPRGGFGTLELQMDLMPAPARDGIADLGDPTSRVQGER